jgi:hypothetical protein
MDFNDYYQFYLSKHQNKNCRRMHLLGQIMTLAFIVFVFTSLSWWWLLLAPFVVYPFAVAGHLFEGKFPAFFSTNPLKAKLADIKMIYEMLTGKLPL